MANTFYYWKAVLKIRYLASKVFYFWHGFFKTKTIKDEKNIRIKCDQSVNFGKAVEILDMARKAGASGVDIVTEQK